MQTPPQAKELVRSLLRRSGFEVRRYNADRWWEGWRPAELGKLATPATVIDVGVGHGTPRLYEAFPHAHQLLLEPLKEFEPDLKRIVKEYRGDYRLVAVGAAPGNVEIRVEREYELTKSSIKPRTAVSDAGKKFDVRSVPVTTIDATVAELGLAGPYVIKIDTEGYELDVIQGATATLTKTQLVIAEVAVAPRFVGGYAFADFIRAMDERGFGLYSILQIAPYRTSHRVVYIDGVFAPHEICQAIA
jgi:FkbM family methyltransferase